MLKKFKNISIALCALALVCSTVYAVTYKVPAAKSNMSLNTNQNIDPNITGNKMTIGNYYVYTPANYSNATTSQGIQQGGVVELVIDYCDNMYPVIEDVKKIALNLFKNIPSTTQIGLRVFGQGGFLRTSTFVLPFAHYSGNEFYTALSRYKTGLGVCPVLNGMGEAVMDLAAYNSNVRKKIIIITDGEEISRCHCDPCKYVKDLAKIRQDFVIDVILTSNNAIDKYACAANTTGGTLYQSDSFDESSLGDVLMQSIQNKPPLQMKPSQQTQNEQRYEYVSD